jgi:adenosylhomocysteine nucleosidase
VITGIVVALPEELSTLISKKLEKGCIKALTDKILVIYSGAGAENANAAAEKIVAQGANQLFSWGCAAALDSAFRPGDLVLANSCVDADNVAFDLNLDRIKQVQAVLSQQLSVRICTGKLAESKTIVSSSLDKAQIAQKTGAIALDMESTAIAKVAQKHGLPFVVIRAIADPLDMNLPKAVSHALNNQGDVVLSKLLSYLLWHPTELPDLISLGLHFHAAKNTLKRVVKHIDAITRFNPQNSATPGS